MFSVCLSQNRPSVNYLFRNRCKAFGGVLGPHVEHVEFSLQRCRHQFVHVDIFPVKLDATYLPITKKNNNQAPALIVLLHCHQAIMTVTKITTVLGITDESIP